MASTKCMLSSLVIGLVALMAFGCCATDPNTTDNDAVNHGAKMVDDNYAVLIYTPTKLFNKEGFEAGRYSEVLREHSLYMEDVNNLSNPINMVMGGTNYDAYGAMYLFKGTLPGELWPISRHDPMVKAGLYKPTVRSWTAKISTLESEVDAMPIFHVAYSAPGKNYDRDKSIYQQKDLGKHIAHLSGLANQGDVVLSGPFSDVRGGGMTIYRASNLNDLEEAISSDPYTKSEMYNNRYSTWLASMK